MYACAVFLKTSVIIVTVGSPCCSKEIPSCKLPDEQPPQSPIPAITMSACRRKASNTSGRGGSDAECFLA